MHENSGPSLPSVLAHARAGALDRAWSLFVAGGHDRNTHDPAALTLKGRLLKDRAMRSAGEARQRLLREAALAYADAAGLGEASYPLINAATLSLLGGDAPCAAALAARVLARIDANPHEPETPYYLAATRAEALLLLGRDQEARAALAEAVAAAPRAWEDHATTLRQFALILAAERKDADWLDASRPPASLHFGGHMSFDARGDHAWLTRDIAKILEAERIGFGFGALAAGADIIVAEALLARGAELHLVLPGGVERFTALSVDPFGVEWRRRFDAALERARTVRAIDSAGPTPSFAAIDVADEAAMGAALQNARRLETCPVQLLVLGEGEGDADNRSRMLWDVPGAGRAQHLIFAPREAVADAPLEPGPIERFAVLAIRLAAEAATLAAAKAVLDSEAAPTVPAAYAGDFIVAGYESVLAAADAALAIAAALGGDVSIGGHYGAGVALTDPFSGVPRITGRLLALASAAAASALPGSTAVTDDFAAALEVRDARGGRSEFIGELVEAGSGAPIGLYALKRL